MAENQEPLVPMLLKFDYWTGKVETAEGKPLSKEQMRTGNYHSHTVVEEKLKAGTVVELPRSIALKLLEEGKATRADPLP